MSHGVGRFIANGLGGIPRADTPAYQEDTGSTAGVTYMRWEGDHNDPNTGAIMPVYMWRVTVASGLLTRESCIDLWTNRTTTALWAPMPEKR